MPSSTACSKPSAFAAVGELVQLAGVLEHLLADREPAQAVADLGDAGTAPERLVPLPDAPRDPLGLRLLHALDERRLEVVRQRGGDRRRAAGHDPLARELDTPDQGVERLHELRDAVAQQRVGHVAHVDPRVREPLEVGRRVLVGGGAAHLELLGAGQQRRHRHRVDRVRRHQPVHVLGLGVLRVLHAGRGPQRALHGAAGLAQAREALAQEELLEAHVGSARVGDRRDPRSSSLPRPPGACPPRCPRARRRSSPPMHVHRLAGVEAPLHAADVGLGDRGVGLDREQQRHVHVDAGGDRLLDRRHPPSVPGILMNRLGRSTRCQ